MDDGSRRQVRTAPTLRQVEDSSPHGLSGVRAVKCHVAKLYRLTQVKNSLPWSRHTHSGPHGYEENFSAAKAAAEEQRVKGGQSWIREVPAIVVTGGSQCVLIASKSPLKPFEEFGDCEFRESLLGMIALRAKDFGYVFVSDLAPEVAQQPFRSFVAKAEDATRPLAWSEKSEARDLQYVKQVISKLQEAMAVDKWIKGAA